QVTVERDGRTSRRYFLQFFTWQSVRDREHVTRTLRWVLVEVGSTRPARVVAAEQLAKLVDVPYPTLTAPAGLLESVTIGTAEGGRVEWVMEALNKRGVFD